MNPIMKILVTLRRERMTLTEVAREMKVSKQHVCNLEREDYGNPSISTVLRYAKAIGAKIVVIDA